MLYLRSRLTLLGLLLLMAMGQPVQAAVETIPPSNIPPPPGELDFLFPNPPPPSFDRTYLFFHGAVQSNSSQHSTVTWKFDWTTPSGDFEYGPSDTFGLEPGIPSQLNAGIAVAGCPSNVGMVFTTNSPTGATVSGTLEHFCTIPEPTSFALLALVACHMLTARE